MGKNRTKKKKTKKAKKKWEIIIRMRILIMNEQSDEEND